MQNIPNEVLAGLFLLLNLADAITTYIVVQHYKGTELNPILRWLMRKIGVVPALVVKMVLAVILAYYMLSHDWALVVVNVLFALVLVNNVNVIKTERRNRVL